MNTDMETEETKNNKEKEKENEEMLKRMTELREMIEKNTKLNEKAQSQPTKVLTKTYIEGTPNSLKNLVSSIIGSFAFNTKGQPYTDRVVAVTLMVEEITPEK